MSRLPCRPFDETSLPMLEHVETRESWTTTSSSSTASNIRGPGRTVGKLISIAGRGLERALASIPEILSPPPEVVLHQKAEQSLKEAKARLFNQKRVLLLGSGDSGKSEVLKQMRFLHKIPYTPSELDLFRILVFRHIKNGIFRILDSMNEIGLVLSDSDKKNAELISIAGDLRDGEPLPVKLHSAFWYLWNDPSVQTIWEERKKFGISENLSYFMSSLDRLFDPAYIPTHQDIMHIEEGRIGTIAETIFKLADSDLIILDPGRFTTERRKWIHYFSDVMAVLFVVNLSGYDECLVENRDVNRLKEAMVVWESVCHSQYFRDTSMILFLNKYELFEQKIKTSNIKDYFPDYEGPLGDVSTGVDYFVDRFARLAQESQLQQTKTRDVYVHVTSSTATDMLRVLLSAVEDITLSRRIRNISLT